MKVFVAMALCGIGFLLASCSGEHPSMCVGGSKASKSLEQTSDVDKYFITTDFSGYIGSPLGELDRNLAIRYERRTGLTEAPARLIGVTYGFPNNYSVDIYFSNVTYTKFNSKTGKWDFRKINKEKISGIRVRHYGSGDYYYCKEFGETRL